MFEFDKQKLLIELLVSNADLFARVNPIIQPSFFDPLLKKSVAFMQDYFEQYKAVPTAQIFKAETGLIVEITKLDKAETHYVADELEKFCRTQAVKEVAMSCPAFLESGDFGTLEANMKAAIQISLNKDLGINYFDNVEQRLLDLLNNTPVMSTGWKDVDDAIGGGISRQELLLFAAASGIGKSVVMANLSMNLVKQGYKVLYISLELADRIVSKRFDGIVTGISQGDILQQIQKVSAQVEKFKENTNGELFIKRMPESMTNSNHIRAYLKEFEQTYGFVPDCIVVDYIDLMISNRKVSQDNIWLADKYKSEELRSIGNDYDCAIVTASQLGRGSLTADKVGQEHIQGGFSKIQAADLMVAIIQTDQMRAAGQYMFEYLKTRNSGAVGSNCLLGWDPIGLRVFDLPSTKDNLVLNKKVKPPETILSTAGSKFDNPNNNSSLLKLMKI
jgi:archaellum biogenesis ATPase FlaH